MTSLDDLEPVEQCEMEEDQDDNEDIQGENKDIDMMDQQGNIECQTVDSKALVMDTTMNSPKSKYIKTENGCASHTMLNLKKEKPKNSHLPSAAQNPSFYSKFSNKAQEFTTHKKEKKKSFEELVLSYLHDFHDIFMKEGLNKLPPERPGIDH
ncbi:hypothetical protein BDR04DRAFT_1164723 [Suillus decipiens]|nr:hypothetical protein BDR04DRAFT_1164723 [Suillus decipiens]